MKNLLKILSLVILPLIHINASAIGFGLYTTAVNSGSAEWDDAYFCFFCNSTSRDTDIDQKEFGVVMDTAVAKDRVFNYRLQIASVDTSYDELDMDGFILTNTFGFGIVRTDSIRVWIGPQIAVKSLESNDSSLDYFGIEYGPAVGLNFHVTPVISLTAETGYRLGDGYVELNNSSIDSDISEDRFFVNIGILFRFGSAERN